VNEGKYRVLSDSLVSAFKEVPRSPTPISIGQNARNPIPTESSAVRKPILYPRQTDDAGYRAKQEKMKHIASNVLEALAPLVKGGQVRVTQSARGIAVEINASVLFKPAEAFLAPDSIAALSAVAKVLANTDNRIEIEGHTDNVPISTSQFPSNWELATARASAVARLFIDNGVQGARLVAMGYAENRPVDTNESLEGRARNRRVTVMILSPDEDGVTELAVGSTPRN
jgi:chemotaxis protein MotB